MAEFDKITIREVADLGPVLARADHQLGAIEVNAKAFYSLPPLVQEFVLCHEVCHLRHDERDEARTNQLAARLFMARATNEADREERSRFLSYIDERGGYSNDLAVIMSIVTGAVGLGTTVWGIIKQRNAGWYSWDQATQRANLDVLLRQAFEASRKTGSKSAAQLFWEQMQAFTNKDDSLDRFLNRSDNAWVRTVITKYEKAYGFGFEQVTPIDLTAFPLAMLAIGLVVGYLVYRIIKKRTK